MEVINHEYYVSLEVAKLLKEAGFDRRVRYMYRNNNPTLCICTETSYRNTPKPNKCPMYWQYAAPALEVAQRWLREVKNVYLDVDTHFNSSGVWFSYVINTLDPDAEFGLYSNCLGAGHPLNTYEIALEAGIKKALEIILKKGE